MKYLLLIYGDEAGMLAASKETVGQMMAAYGAYTEAVKKSGVYVGSNRLRPTASGTTVRVANGKTEVLDGPYAETKEQLGGIGVLEARDMNHAVQLMSQHPSLKYGTLWEIRPTHDMSEIIRASEQRRRQTTVR